MAAILVDTNVLIFAHDCAEPRKQQRALDVLDRLVAVGTGVLSAQVLSEFYSTSTRKITAQLSPAQARDQIEHFLKVWRLVDVTGAVVLQATRGVCDYQFSFWDAQIWAVARLNQVPVSFSEDFNSGAVIEGVQFVDSFAEDFQPEAWGL